VIEIILRNPVLPILFIALPAFAVFVPDYATTGNLQNLLLQSAVLALLVAGGATVVISGNFDLSVEGTLAFSATVAAWLMYDKSPGSGFGLNGTLAVLVTVLVGIAVGVINGLMVEALHVNPFIVTLGTLLTLKGAAAIPTSAQTLYGLPSSYSGVARQAYFGVNLIVLIAAVLYAGIAVYMTRAVAARHIYAVGGNKRAARENGVNPLKSIIFVYCISGPARACGLADGRPARQRRARPGQRHHVHRVRLHRHRWHRAGRWQGIPLGSAGRRRPAGLDRQRA
jgi:ribose/xylose/arabinose/galactoside ABC-type transport system permease subunit